MVEQSAVNRLVVGSSPTSGVQSQKRMVARDTIHEQPFFLFTFRLNTNLEELYLYYCYLKRQEVYRIYREELDLVLALHQMVPDIQHN